MSYICLTLCLILTIFLQFIKVNCIINGDLTTGSAFPSTVLVKFNDSSYCGGSIIYPKYVLTSGVCGSNKGHMVGIGINFVDLFKHGPGEIVPIEHVVIHPHFTMSRGTAVNDIALIILKKKIEFSKQLYSIPVYEKPFVIGLKCEVAGWGMVNDGLLTSQNVSQPWPPENVLRKSKQIIVDIDRCQELIYKEDLIKLSRETHACGRGYDEKQGPAFGDFGGPLICNGKQAAITTHSLYDSETKHLYTVYTRIFSNIPWIDGIVENGINFNIYKEERILEWIKYKKQKFLQKFDNRQNAVMINKMIYIIIPILHSHVSSFIINLILSLTWKVSTPLILWLNSIFKYLEKHTCYL